MRLTRDQRITQSEWDHGSTWTLPPDRLYHFTCADHGHRALGEEGVIRPNWHPLLGASLVWMTTEGQPDRESTGLGMHITTCDRMAYRYVVSNVGVCAPWLLSRWRHASPPQVVSDLESYGDPEHWWVTDQHIVGRLD